MDAVSGVICASVDPALGYTEACSSAAAAGGLVSTTLPADAQLTGVTVDASSGLRTVALAGAEEGEEDAAVLDLTADVRRLGY